MRVLIDCQTLSTTDIDRGIGRYLRNILRNLVTLFFPHDRYFVLLSSGERTEVRELTPDTTDTILTPQGALPDDCLEVQQRMQETIRAAIHEHKIDILWNPNPLMVNVLPTELDFDLPTVATVHDLIPLKLATLYLRNWPEPLRKHYMNRIGSLRRFDRLLAVSESTRSDICSLCSIPREKIEVTHSGVDDTFHAMQANPVMEGTLRARFGLNHRFLLYTGGFDPRKNQENLMRALALLRANGNTDLRLVIVCECDLPSKNKLVDFATGLGVADSVVVSGYLTDLELATLYRLATVFVFPSLYEGFGLPILEAMASGTPVAVSNCSSMPEVAGDAALFFDPHNPEEIANVVGLLLCNSELRRDLVRRGLKRATEFSWVETARKTQNVLKQTAAERRAKESLSHSTDKKLQIAFFSPFNPQPSGISDYSESLLEHLRNYADVDLFVDGITPSNPWIRECFRWYDMREYLKEKTRSRYDIALYHMGNNVLHERIYEFLQAFPGVTVLHDYNIHPFIQYISYLDGKPKKYIEEMVYAYGPEGQQLARQVLAGDDHLDIFRFPLNKRVIDSSKAIICHSNWVKQQLGSPKAHVIPSGTKLEDVSQVQDPGCLDSALSPNDFVVGCFGNLTLNRRLHVVLPAFIRLQVRVPQAKLLLVGQLHDEVKQFVLDEIGNNQIQSSVVLTGRVSLPDFLSYLRRSDVAVNLRYPTMGETSAIAMRALGMGKPLLVTNFAQFAELPEGTCLKIDLDGYESELLEETLFELFYNHPLRRLLSHNARKYVREVCSWEIVAEQYYEVLRKYV